jgi:hypothetical protein
VTENGVSARAAAKAKQEMLYLSPPGNVQELLDHQLSLVSLGMVHGGFRSEPAA